MLASYANADRCASYVPSSMPLSWAFTTELERRIPRSAASDLGLHCLPMSPKMGR